MTNALAAIEVRRVNAARRLVSIFAETLDLDLSVALWDGSTIPLGREVQSSYRIVIENAGVLSSLIRRPTLDNLALHYARGSLTIEGGDLLGFIRAAESGRGFKKLRRMPKWRTLRAAFGVARTRPEHAAHRAALRGDGENTTDAAVTIDERLVRFHYDIGNEFYALFLGDEMQYSCGYFEDPSVDLDTAQDAKLDRICRSLRLKRDERLLDVGCGWGGLICHAARRYGVRAHGLTLSKEQYEYSLEKIGKLGLEDRVSVELSDYREVDVSREGVYDKIASIEMSEHIGVAAYPDYFRKLRSVLREDGLILNQATTRRAKRTVPRSRRLRAGSKLMERHVFPGFELDHVGNTISAIEGARFEVQQVIGWREHYARTTEIWYRRLWDRRREAETIVGEEKIRLWLAYLAGVATAFQIGSLRVYQIVASKPGSSRSARTKADETLG